MAAGASAGPLKLQQTDGAVVKRARERLIQGQGLVEARQRLFAQAQGQLCDALVVPGRRRRTDHQGAVKGGDRFAMAAKPSQNHTLVVPAVTMTGQPRRHCAEILQRLSRIPLLQDGAAQQQCINGVRRCPQHLADTRQRLGALTLLIQHQRQEIARLGMAGRRRQNLPVKRSGLGKPPLLMQRCRLFQ